MQNKDAVCAFCSQKTKLCDSHAIPNWYLNLLREQGKFVVYSEANNFTYMTGTGDRAPLLCEVCESDFNRLFDIPMQLAFSDMSKRHYIKSDEAKIIGKAALSIFWRASLLSSDFYRNFNLGDKIEGVIRNIFSGKSIISERYYSISIQRMYDDTPGEGTDVNLVCYSPAFKKVRIGSQDHLCLLLIMNGYIINIYINKIKNRYAKELSLVSLRNGITNVRMIGMTKIAQMHKAAHGMRNSKRSKAIIKLDLST